MNKINDKNVNDSNKESTVAANNSIYKISKNKELYNFLRICDDRFSGKNKFADNGYIIGIVESVDFLIEINKYFYKNKLNLEKIKANRIFIKLSNKVSTEEIGRIRILKSDDYSYVEDKLRVLDKAINKRLKPEVLKFLINNDDKAGIKRNIENARSSILNVELSWYYKHLLRTNIDLVSKIHFNPSKFELYNKSIIENYPLKNFYLINDSKYISKILGNSFYKKVNKNFIRDYLVINPEVKTYEQSLEFAYLLKCFYDNASYFSIDNKFRKFILTESHKLLSYLLINYKERFISLEAKFGKVLREKINGCNTLFGNVWGIKDKLNYYLETLVSTDQIKNVIITDNIIKDIKKLDFFFVNLFAILTKIKNTDIDLESRNELIEIILSMKNASQELLSYIDTFRAFRIKNRNEMISFNTKDGSWLNKKSVLEKHDFRTFPEDIGNWIKNYFFKIATIKTEDKNRLFHWYGLSYFYNVVPAAYNAFSDLLNVLKIYLINLEIILKNNINLSKLMRMDSDSSDVLDSLFNNYIETTETMKTIYIDIINNIDLIGTGSSIVTKNDLLKFKEIVDEQLNVSNEFNSIWIMKKTVGFNSRNVSKEEYKEITKLISIIDWTIKYIKNASIGMSVAINFLIESMDLIIKDSKSKDLIENDDLFDIMTYIDKVKHYSEIVVPFKTNIQRINKTNWFDSERIFSTSSSKIVNREIANIYENIKKINTITENHSAPANFEHARRMFESIWNLYVSEQGIVHELSKLATKTEDLANDRYLKIAFTKSKLELFETNLVINENRQSLIEDMLSHKLWLLKIYASEYDIYNSLLRHKKISDFLINKLEKIFVNSRYGFETLTAFIFEWSKNKKDNLKKLKQINEETRNVKIKFMNETVSNFYSFVDMDKISEIPSYNEWMPKAIFAKFVSKKVINSAIDLVPIINYEKGDESVEHVKTFISPYDQLVKKERPNKVEEPVVKENIQEEIIEEIQESIIEQKTESIKNIRYVNFELLEPEINIDEINKIIFNNLIEDEQFPTEETVQEPINEEIIEVHEETPVEIQEPIKPIVDTNFEDEKLNIIQLDMIDDSSIQWEKISVANDNWIDFIPVVEQIEEPKEEIVIEEVQTNDEQQIETVIVDDSIIINEPVEEEIEYIYTDETPLSDDEIIQIEKPITKEEPKEYQYVDEFAPYADPIQEIEFEEDQQISEIIEQEPISEIIEENNDEIETVFADESQLSDNELIQVESVQEEPTDEIEYIYADQTPLTDAEMLIPEIIEVVENNNESTTEEFVVVDESAPYADPIKEVEFEEEEEEETSNITEQLTENINENNDEIETVFADESQLSDEELIQIQSIEEVPAEQIEYIYADETPLTDAEMLIPEIIEVVDNNEESSPEEFVVVDEFAPYANPIKEVEFEEKEKEESSTSVEEPVIEINDEVIETVFADESQLSDDELIQVESVQEEPTEQIEYIYADETLLTDAEMLIPEIIEVVDNNEESSSEEFVVVDESAPYADPIKEVEFEEEEEETSTIIETPIEEVQELINIEENEPIIEFNEQEISSDINQIQNNIIDDEKFENISIQEFDDLNNVLIDFSPIDSINENEEEFDIDEPIVEQIIEETSTSIQEPIETIIEENNDEIETVFADDSQLSDEELIQIQSIEEVPAEQIEYIYADETPLTDAEMLIPEIIEVVDNNEESSSEEFVVVDESAPYADPIKEVDFEEEEETSTIIETPIEEVQELINIKEKESVNESTKLIESIIAKQNENIENKLELFDDFVSLESDIEREFSDLTIYNKDFESNNDEIETVFADESQLSDDELIEIELVNQKATDEIEYIYADENPLTDAEMLIPEIVEVVENDNETTAEEFVVVDESAPYADPIKEVEFEEKEQEESSTSVEESVIEINDEVIETAEEENNDEIETVFADDSQLSDEELIQIQSIEEVPAEQIEYIYADENPLTDAEMLIPEIIEVVENDNETTAEEFVVVDESAPYADPIKEVEFEEKEEETSTIIETATEEVQELINIEENEPIIEFNEEVSNTIENNQLINDNEKLSKVINMTLNDPEATDKELDWTELDANSHIDFIEEPLFVKIFEIDY